MNSAEVQDFSLGFFKWDKALFGQCSLSTGEGHLGSVALGQTSAVHILIPAGR